MSNERWLEVLSGPAHEVAPQVLNATLRIRDVTLRLTELEAYDGVGRDPGSHAFRGRTARNNIMFAGAGHLYVYLSYGIHLCLNLVCGEEGLASALLVRAGEVAGGLDAARARRGPKWLRHELARGPGRVGQALGVTRDDNGASLDHADYQLTLPGEQSPFRTGPRIGIRGPGGSDAFPWRFWIPDDPTVSPYRATP